MQMANKSERARKLGLTSLISSLPSPPPVMDCQLILMGILSLTVHHQLHLAHSLL